MARRLRSNKELKDMRLNRDVAVGDADFMDACKMANIKPTARQAGKWKRKVGLAYAAARFARINSERYKPHSPELYNALTYLNLRRPE